MLQAKQKQQDNMYWDIYVVKSLFMDETNYISFEDFKRPGPRDDQSEEEILIDVKDIIDTFNKGVN